MNTSFEPQSQTPTRRAPRQESRSAKARPSRTIVHAKLEMTEPGDHDEQEADAVANAIVSGGKISRKISGGGGSSGIAVSQQMESQLSQLQGGGRQMPEGLRNMMESGFGQDFSQVRLHTDNEAASMSSSIQAKAFTLGNDIYFNRGQFAPETSEGQRLVAHELTHVVQGGKQVARQTGDPSDVSGTSWLSSFIHKLSPHSEEERKPSQNDYANCYIFNLNGVLSSESSANSLKDEVVVDDGKQIIKTGLSMEQFLYITAVVQHEAASTDYTYEELFAVARIIVNATKEKNKKSEFDLVRTGFSSVGVDKKGVDKKMEHIYKYKKDSNAFIGDLKSNKNDKFQSARKATLSVFALKTATLNEQDITIPEEDKKLWKKYENATRWDGADFYENLTKGTITKEKKDGDKTVKVKVIEMHNKIKENKVIIIPKDILVKYYKANGDYAGPHFFYNNDIIVENNGIYYIKGGHKRDALIAVGNAGKSIIWKKKRGKTLGYKEAANNNLYNLL